MPKFVTIGYGDREGYERTSPEARAAAHEHDSHLLETGAVSLVGVAGTPVQVRNHEGAGVHTSEGAFLRSALPVAGFAIVEAADAEEAARLVSGTPCAVAHGVVEVWPLDETP